MARAAPRTQHEHTLSFPLGKKNPPHQTKKELDGFYLINAYVPNAGVINLSRLDYRVKQWDPAFADYVRLLAVDKPVVVAGDLNCAHEEIDIDRPEHNRSNPGFSASERASFAAHLLGGVDKGGCALIDTFRAKYGPDTVGFTFYGEFF